METPEGVSPFQGWDELFQVGRHFLIRIGCAVDFGGDAVEVPPDEATSSAVDQEVGDILAQEAFSGVSGSVVVATGEVNVGESEVTNVEGEETIGGVEDLLGYGQRFMDEAAYAVLDVIVDEKDLEVFSDRPASLEGVFFDESLLEVENVKLLGIQEMFNLVLF